MVKAVFFDIGGTIHTQHLTEVSERIYREQTWRLLNKNGITTEDSPERLYAHIKKGASIYKAFSEREKRELPADQIWRDFILKEYSPGERLTGLGEQLSFLYDNMRKEIVKRPGLHKTLETLQEMGIRMGVISNIISRTFVPYILKEYKIDHYFETVITSADCGIRKPDPRIFQLALEKMNLAKEEACYVGDTFSRDVLGAKEAGWKMMIQIDNPLTYHRDDAFKNCSIYPDYHITNLTEIIPIMQANRK